MEKNSPKLLNIALIESSFKRELKLDFNKKDLENNINIDIEKSINESNKNLLYITVILNFEAAVKTKKYITSTIKMLGVFEFGGSSTLSLDDFGSINAPAIIYPFIREHLANVSMKAGISAILLPPVNFVQLAKDKNK